MPINVARHSELIPGYRLLERLGEGGFGEVWKAEAPGGLLKAVKIISSRLQDDGEETGRLRQELKALNRVRTVRHPFILSLERFEIVDGRLVIVMELADRSLWDRFKECRNQGLPGIPRDELLRYMEETAEALDVMNVQYDLQHLDIKPQNLFLLYNHVKVGDFGLVKDLEGMSARATCGVTAVYAAPETFGGVVSRFCDQYNLAVAYQELLTGRLPFDGTSSRQLMMQHVMGEPNLRPLPEGDRPVVARALAKKPEERHPSCQAFVQALRGAAGPEPVPGGQAAVVTSTAGSAGPTRITPATQLVWPRRREGGRVLVDPDDAPTPTPACASPAPTASAAGATPRPAARVDTPRFVAPFQPPPERPETTGDGVLFPALVVGLGGLGGDVLRQLRKALRKRSPAATPPHIRLLHLDTDPEAVGQATPGEPDAVLSPDEVLVTRFLRPAHYLKRQKERQELEQWLPLTALTRVPRDQVTAGGWRALGRLAFVSNYPAVAARLREELDACVAPAALAAAERQTGLGLRTTRPRAYVVTSLAGGTGGGMFLDLAYGLRRLFHRLGYPRAEVVGLFLLPGPERGAESARTVINAYAALTELRHFAAPGAVFTGAGQDREDGGAGRTPPFSRCVLLPLPATGDGPAAGRELTAQAGDFLSRDLLTDLGRAADEGRVALRLPAERLPCQTFGTYSFSVPRRPLLQRVTQTLCERLVRGWRVATPAALEERVRPWVAAQLARWELTPECLASRLREAWAAALGQSPEAFCHAAVGRWARGGPDDLGRQPAAADRAVAEIEALVTPPRRTAEPPGRLLEALQEAGRAVAEDAEKRLAEVALGALMEPQFRLIAAEVAVQREVQSGLARAARGEAERGGQRGREAQEVRKRMAPLVETLRGGSFLLWGRKARTAEELGDLFREYVAAGRDAALVQEVGRVYHHLQTNLHKYLLAVDCCHDRLGEFVESFEAHASGAGAPADLGLGRYLLPGGSRTLDEAVDRVLASLTAEEEEELHRKVQGLIGEALQAHLHLCTAPPAHFMNLREAIAREVAVVAETSLGRAHAAELYLEQHAEDPAVDADLADAFDEAQPELAGARDGPRQGLCILAVPPGPEGERFRSLVEHALPDEEMLAAPSTDDIVFYREQPQVSLAGLPQLGPAAREAYEQALASEQLSPHSRLDVARWLPGTGAPS
jgi:hypothetical protein